jgi:hypothetical protein
MSSGFQHVSLATSSSVADSLEEAAIGTIMERPLPPMKAETGEEVYLRRLAMSQAGSHPPQPAPPKVTSAQLPSNKGEDLCQPPGAPSGQLTPLLPLQGPSEPSDLAECNSIAPQPVPPPPPSISGAPSAFTVTPDFEERVRNSRNAVAAIAARFTALAPPVESEDSSQPVPAPEESAPEPPKRCASYSSVYHRNPDLTKIRPSWFCCAPDGKMGAQRGAGSRRGWKWYDTCSGR